MVNQRLTYFDFKMKKVALVILSLSIPAAVTATGYTWAQAWVKKESIPIQALENVALNSVRHGTLALVLLGKEALVTTQPNGNTYLQLYVLNDTDSVATIARADATLAGTSSEIFVRHKWRLFQEGFGSSCGNSYWSQKLAAKHAMIIQYDHSESGPIKVPFRVKFTKGHQVVVSNAITVEIDSANYSRVKK